MLQGPQHACNAILEKDDEGADASLFKAHRSASSSLITGLEISAKSIDISNPEA
jgi:hypothetical protein